jgi:hypothetical protein
MHCSDEELLANLDGELTARKRAAVGRHLESCWQCRTRAAACERQIQRLTELMDHEQFPGPDWLAEKRLELRRRMQEAETTLPCKEATRPRAIPARVTWGALAAACVAAVTLGWLERAPAPAALKPAETIAHVLTAENALYVRPVEQVFSVQIAQTFPFRPAASGKLQVWSDQSTRRFASRWTGERGALKQAMWQPSGGTGLIYEASDGLRKARRTADEQPALAAIAADGLDASHLETGFMRWIESRSWTPVAFTPEISMWSRADGAVARAETIRAADGSALVRITAQRRTRGITVTLTIEADSRTWLPRLQAIRFESAEKVVELRLASERIQPVAETELEDAIFRPDIPTAAATRVVAPRVDVESPPIAAAGGQPVAISEQDSRAVEAHFALHKAGACLGAAVTVEAVAEGIRIVSLGGGAGARGETVTAEARLEDVMGALSDLRRPPQVPSDDAGTSVSTIALRHAWALARLGEDFPASRVAALPERGRRLLESMERDHLSGIRRETGNSNASLLGAARTPAAAGGEWRASAAKLFDWMLSLRNGPPSAQASFDDLETMMDEIEVGIASESAGTHALQPAAPVKQ